MLVKMDVRTDGGYHTFTVGFSTEAQALTYIGARQKTHVFDEIEATPIPRTWTELLDLLYPTCHHGLDARMCMDPIGDAHFGTREWEMAQYGEW